MIVCKGYVIHHTSIYTCHVYTATSLLPYLVKLFAFLENYFDLSLNHKNHLLMLKVYGVAFPDKKGMSKYREFQEQVREAAVHGG